MARTARRVIQCDKDGKEIASFPSAKDASKHFGSDYPNAIHRSIRYGCLAFGYRWKYEGMALGVIPTHTPGKKRSIIALDISTGDETIYPSLSDASRSLSIPLSAIESSLMTGNKAKGYRFGYADVGIVTPAKKRPLSKEIEAVDDTGKVIATYSSASEASKALGVSLSMIYWCTVHKENTRRCKGYRLRYKAM